MPALDELIVLSSLQRVALDTEDPDQLLPNIITSSLKQFAAINYLYQFICVLFMDPQKKIQHSFLADSNPKMNNAKIPAILSLESLMESLPDNLFITPEVTKFISSSYYGIQQIKSLIISPINFAGSLRGLVILAGKKEGKDITLEEKELIMAYTNSLATNFKIADTEQSLTKITRQVYEMNAKLHELDKLKDDFVSVASHELRTPMTAIRSYAWMALYKSDIPLSQKMERYLYRTLISTERLINLVNDMLNVSRIESGRIEISPTGFDIVSLVKDVVEEVKIKANEKNLTISVLEHTLPQVFADADKIHEVLLNLIGNSIKFCFPDGNIVIDFFTGSNMIEISIKDNGPGIVKEDANKLFKKFGKLDSSYVAVSTSGGTGLGLYISKSLVELMHGTIRAKSEGVNKGATFTFSLPIATKELLAEAEKYHVKPKGEVKQLERAAI